MPVSLPPRSNPQDSSTPPAPRILLALQFPLHKRSRQGTDFLQDLPLLVDRTAQAPRGTAQRRHCHLGSSETLGTAHQKDWPNQSGRKIPPLQCTAQQAPCLLHRKIPAGRQLLSRKSYLQDSMHLALHCKEPYQQDPQSSSTQMGKRCQLQ